MKVRLDTCRALNRLVKGGSPAFVILAMCQPAATEVRHLPDEKEEAERKDVRSTGLPRRRSSPLQRRAPVTANGNPPRRQTLS